MMCTSCVGFLALCLLSFCTLPLSAYVADKRNAPSESGVKFRLTQVSKENTENGYLVQLYLEGSEFPKVSVVTDVGQGSDEETLEVTAEGVVQYHINHNESGNVHFFLLHPRGYHGISILADEQRPSLQLIPDMRVSFQGRSEITYTEGEDVNLNITCTVDDVYNMTVEPVSYISFYTKSENGYVMAHRFGDQSPLRMLDEGHSYNLVFTNILINTSGNVAGLLNTMAYYIIQCEKGCLVDSYSIVEDVPVYQEDHDRPFSDNFIGIIRHYSDEDTSEHFCSLYGPHYYRYCPIWCDLIGDHPSLVEMFRVGPSGELTPTNGVSLSNNGYRAVGQLNLANYTSADSGEYQCKSRSGKVEFTHTVRVIIGKEARLMYHVTDVNISEDKSVVATCGAEGDPAPTVVIKDNTGQPISEDRSDVQVTVTQLNDTMTLAEIHITDPSVASSLVYLTCEVENTIQGRLFTDSTTLYVTEDYDTSNSASYFLEHVVGA